MISYKQNKIKVDIASYRHYWRGAKKIGKTTMFRDLVLEAYTDPSFGLLISTGNETGYKALDSVFAVETKTWDDFVRVVDDLVENGAQHNFKVIAIDTVDELVEIASGKALSVHRTRYGKDAKSLNDALGGYGAGRNYVKKIINEQIARLEAKGYGLIFIGHTKLKDIKETAETDAYQQVASNLEQGYDSIFSDKADIIATFYTKRIVKDGIMDSAERYIYFRNDGFIDCGTRLSGMPDKVGMSANNYIKAFEEGVRSSSKVPMTEEELKLRKEQEIKERKQKTDTYAEESVEEIQRQVIEMCQKLGGSGNQELLDMLDSFGQRNPNRIKEVGTLKDIRESLQIMMEKKQEA